MIHEHFGKLTVLSFHGKGKYGQRLWWCRCDCGGDKIASSHQLTSGHTKSCGCLFATHRMTKSPEYSTWVGIRDRCYNQNAPSFVRYGGRGIAVCDRWLESFENFYEDMGARSSKDHSIDRIDNNGPYSPENCRWATRSQQQRNARRTVIVQLNGVKMSMTSAAEIIGMKPNTLNERIRRGWKLPQGITPLPKDAIKP